VQQSWMCSAQRNSHLRQFQTARFPNKRDVLAALEDDPGHYSCLILKNYLQIVLCLKKKKCHNSIYLSNFIFLHRFAKRASEVWKYLRYLRRPIVECVRLAPGHKTSFSQPTKQHISSCICETCLRGLAILVH